MTCLTFSIECGEPSPLFVFLNLWDNRKAAMARRTLN